MLPISILPWNEVLPIYGETGSALEDEEQAFSFEQLRSEKVTEASIGRTSLTFQWEGKVIRDEETGSRWSVSGRAIDGPLAGAQLESPVSINHFWFSWNAFQK